LLWGGGLRSVAGEAGGTKQATTPQQIVLRAMLATFYLSIYYVFY